MEGKVEIEWIPRFERSLLKVERVNRNRKERKQKNTDPAKNNAVAKVLN